MHITSASPTADDFDSSHHDPDDTDHNVHAPRSALPLVIPHPVRLVVPIPRRRAVHPSPRANAATLAGRAVRLRPRLRAGRCAPGCVVHLDDGAVDRVFVLWWLCILLSRGIRLGRAQFGMRNQGLEDLGLFPRVWSAMDAVRGGEGGRGGTMYRYAAVPGLGLRGDVAVCGAEGGVYGLQMWARLVSGTYFTLMQQPGRVFPIRVGGRGEGVRL